jgi:hypothetical protein
VTAHIRMLNTAMAFRQAHHVPTFRPSLTGRYPRNVRL